MEIYGLAVLVEQNKIRDEDFKYSSSLIFLL